MDKPSVAGWIIGYTPEEVSHEMDGFSRATAEQVREKMRSGSGLLVCAYDDEEKFKRNHLSGAISLAEFRSRLTSIPKSQEIIFYCA